MFVLLLNTFNLGVVAVPDERLDKLTEMYNLEKVEIVEL